MNEQQLIKLLESAEGTIARLMLEVNRLSKELEQRNVSDEEIIEVWDEYYEDIDIITFARAILRKASEG
jgi:DNA/RNA-binding domain of Phe-tRNA-synthetase-like protein